MPELTESQMQRLSETAEKAARNYVLSQVPRRKVSALDIIVETTGSKPLKVSVDVHVILSPDEGEHNVEELANKATEKALCAVEQNLRELGCRSKKSQAS
jgi:hypothetical protein